MNYKIDRAQVKANSKAQLGNNLFGKLWLMALAAALIQALIVSVAGYIPVVGYFAPIVLAGPFGIGISLIFMKLARNHNAVDLADLFTSFSQRFGKDFLLGLMIYVFTFLWSLLFFIPGIVKGYAYSMSYFISLDNPTWGWKECIEESKKITQGHKGELFVLDLSFIGWYILGSLCLGVGMLWVVPYHNTARANYYEALKANAQPAYVAAEPVQNAPQAPVQ